MSKDKKNITPKPRAEKYEEKVSIKTTFNGALELLAAKANKAVKDRQEKPKK